MTDKEFIMRQIRDKQDQIAQKKKELELAENKEMFSNHAKRIHLLYQSYIDAGFSEEQAWQMFNTLFQRAVYSVDV